MLVHHFDKEKKILTLKFSGLQTEKDARLFFSVMDFILKEPFSFYLYVETEGIHSFPHPYQKALSDWFKNNKVFLKEKCLGMARIIHHPNFFQKWGGKAMGKLLPFPYFITENVQEAVHWLEQEQHKRMKEEL